MPVFNMLEFLKIKKGLKGIFNIFGEEGAGRDVVGNGKRRFFRRKGGCRDGTGRGDVRNGKKSWS